MLAALGADRAAASEKIEAFEAMVRRWNDRCALVSRRDCARLRERHVLDSLALLPWWRGRLADVGSGGGFPGVPLAIARPGCAVVLIERSRRKSLFLRQATIDLALDNVSVVTADAAQYRPATLFDTVAVRAVAPPAAAWRLVRGLIAPGGAALMQSTAPLDGALFEDGEVRRVDQAGVGWVTEVGVPAAGGVPHAADAGIGPWQGG